MLIKTSKNKSDLAATYKALGTGISTSYGALTGLSIGTLLWYIDQLKDEEHKKWFLKLLGYALGSGALGGLAGKVIGHAYFPEKNASSKLPKRASAISDVSAIAGTTTGLLAWLNRLRKKERYENWFRDLVLLVAGGYLTGLSLGYSIDASRAFPKILKDLRNRYDTLNAQSQPPNTTTQK